MAKETKQRHTIYFLYFLLFTFFVFALVCALHALKNHVSMSHSVLFCSPRTPGGHLESYYMN